MLPKEEFEKRMIEFLQEEIFEENIQITPEQTLESIGVQSIELMELVFFVEREFDCKLKANSLSAENLKSVRALADEVYRLSFNALELEKSIA